MKCYWKSYYTVTITAIENKQLIFILLPINNVLIKHFLTNNNIIIFHANMNTIIQVRESILINLFLFIDLKKNILPLKNTYLILPLGKPAVYSTSINKKCLSQCSWIKIFFQIQHNFTFNTFNTFVFRY